MPPAVCRFEGMTGADGFLSQQFDGIEPADAVAEKNLVGDKQIIEREGLFVYIRAFAQ